MSTKYTDLAKKILSLALTFNSIISIISVGNILGGSYTIGPLGRPYSPYSPYNLHGSLFGIVILTAFLNIIPSRMIGKVHIDRFLFHHYFYGFLAMISSISLIASLWPGSLTSVLTPTSTSASLSFQGLVFYTDLFFLYGGLTLFLDDLPDVSLRLNKVLSRLKGRAQKSSKTLQFVHLCGSLITIYVSLALFAWFIEGYRWLKDLPMWFWSHAITVLSLLINGSWGLKVTKKKIWFQT